MRTSALARTRRLAITLLAAAGIVATTAATPALAGESASSTSSGTYLALGDSVPFGYYASANSSLYLDPDNFVGYPEDIARARDLHLLNASCPGETTDSFINVTAQSNGCENRFENGQQVPGGYRTLYPLHVQYASPLQSQLQYALSVLKTRHDVRLVTLMVGANDTFLCQKETADQCTSSAEVLAVAAHVQANLERILGALRSQGHYAGDIVVVNYYALNYADKQATAATAVLDKAMNKAATDNQAHIASGFYAYLPIAVARGGGDTQKAGLVRPNDVHPTPFGQEVLARAVLHALAS